MKQGYAWTQTIGSWAEIKSALSLSVIVLPTASQFGHIILKKNKNKNKKKKKKNNNNNNNNSNNNTANSNNNTANSNDSRELIYLCPVNHDRCIRANKETKTIMRKRTSSSAQPSPS